MAIFQALIFLVLGIGICFIVYQSLSRGSLPCGPNGLKGRLEFHRSRQPALYWLMFAVYTVAGIGLVVFALRLLFGLAAPLPL